MQKRALIAMQYSALHHRTWKTPTVQKPCRNRAAMAYKKKRSPQPQELRQTDCGDRFYDEGENEDSKLTLVCAGGDSLNVELLHDDKQDGNGNGHQYTACTELRKIRINQTLIQHLVQTNGNGIFGRNTRI